MASGSTLGRPFRTAFAAGLVAVAAACSSASVVAPASTTSPTVPVPSSVIDQAVDPAPPATPAATVVPQGFGSTVVRLTEPDGATCERCVLLAATLEEHRRGLMGVTSLGGFDGMAFVYDPPKVTSFWMRDTVMPLSIRFYDRNGVSLADFAMDPCVTDSCPTFGPGTEFAVGIEVEQGRLEELGFTDSATLELLGMPCEAAIRTG